VADAASRAAAALGRSDVLLYTSRAVVRGRDAADGLAIARAVSAALSQTVRQALAAEPAWVIAKGGITSHDVARRGLGIRRAEVAGQLFPGVISLFRPIDAAPQAVGMPYIVFAGNVGDDQALAQVVAILNEEQRLPAAAHGPAGRGVWDAGRCDGSCAGRARGEPAAPAVPA
jgi:uncharacterized protein YgbK (DUF1537 family)